MQKCKPIRVFQTTRRLIAWDFSTTTRLCPNERGVSPVNANNGSDLDQSRLMVNTGQSLDVGQFGNIPLNAGAGSLAGFLLVESLIMLALFLIQ